MIKQPNNLKQLALALQGKLIGINHPFTLNNSLSIDTRSLLPGQLFIALEGNQVDGHHYVPQAFEKGAIACIVSKPIESTTGSLLSVSDTSKTLTLIAKLYRHYFSGLVIGLTGSCGKTSTKEMITHILNQTGVTLSTYKNYNNLIGVPLTLSQLQPKHQYAVVEMGTNQPGEINQLTQLVQPDIRLLLNAEAAHLEQLKDIAGVAKEKGDILNNLSSHNTVILNKDSGFFNDWNDKAAQQSAKIKVFSIKNTEVDVYATHIKPTEQGTLFQLCTLQKKAWINFLLRGEHQVSNACAATAIALAAGINWHIIVQSLQTMQPYAGRGQCFSLSNGAIIIDDSYNANPFSTKAAIDSLSESQQPVKVLILGDMGELGPFQKQAHQEIGYYARLKGIDSVLTCGHASQWTLEGFQQGGKHFELQSELIHFLTQDFIQPQMAILIKGSRSSKMENIVSFCKQYHHNKLNSFIS